MAGFPNREWQMTAERQLRFWIIGLVIVAVALYLLRGVLVPFVAGMAIAYLLDPVCDRIERLGCSRTIATTIVTILFVTIFVSVLLLLVPLIQSQIVDLITRAPQLVEALTARAAPLIALIEKHLSIEEVGQLRSMIGGQAGGILRWIGQALAGVLSSGLALFSILSLVFITPIVTFYLLRDWDRLIGRLDQLLPRHYAGVVRQQARLIDETLAGYARGQATVCLVLATFYGLGLTLVGLEFGAAVGIVTGLLSFVPFVGATTGFVVGIGIALAQFSEWTSVFLVAGVFAVGQVLEGNFLTPKLVGDRIGLHPVWVIFALLAGGALFGFIGVLLALPVSAIVGVLVRFGTERYRASPLYLGGLAMDDAPKPATAEAGPTDPPAA
jgi:predicted PurR-regulated permease PerM